MSHFFDRSLQMFFRNSWSLKSNLMVGVALSLANIGLAEDNDNSKPERSSNNSAGEQRESNDRNQGRDQDGRAENDDDAEHHAGLGVSLKESDGRVTVIAVMPGSPAANAGLRVGDEIRYVDDQRIRTAEGLAEEIGEHQQGSKVDLAIRRNGEKQTLNVRLGSRDWASGGRDRGRQGWDSQQQSNMRGNRLGMQANRRRASYSYDQNRQGDGSQQQVVERLRSIQQRVRQLDQEIGNLQSMLGESRSQDGSDRNQEGVYRGQNGGQQGFNRSQSYRQSDRNGRQGDLDNANRYEN